jgi:anhydro-N-acetylmuramic acid kinase
MDPISRRAALRGASGGAFVLPHDYASKETRRVIGLMSGTSADGIDAALVRVSGSGETLEAALEAFRTMPYPPAVRRAVLGLSSPPEEGRPAPSVADVCSMSFALGRLFGEAALELIKRAELEPGDVDLIASHGQTICHLPPRGAGAADGYGTLQIGEPAMIAEITGITVVADFRPRDMAAGGQGAPLVPYADYVLFRSAEKTRAVQNIGGIANVTLLPAGVGVEEVIAFDTGPGNMIVDALVTLFSEGKMQFDEDGRLGALGEVDEPLLSWLMGHEFIARKPPKSAGREQFGAAFVTEILERAQAEDISAESLLATATAFTAESIADSYRRFLLPRLRGRAARKQGRPGNGDEPAGWIDEVILGGGGSYNATLRRMLQERLPWVDVLLHEDFGVRSDAKEAIAFAILGNETMLGRPANVPSATGARHPAILGKIVLA